VASKQGVSTRGTCKILPFRRKATKSVSFGCNDSVSRLNRRPCKLQNNGRHSTSNSHCSGVIWGKRMLSTADVSTLRPSTIALRPFVASSAQRSNSSKSSSSKNQQDPMRLPNTSMFSGNDTPSRAISTYAYGAWLEDTT
jgi:hypothetical protein